MEAGLFCSLRAALAHLRAMESAGLGSDFRHSGHRETIRPGGNSTLGVRNYCGGGNSQPLAPRRLRHVVARIIFLLRRKRISSVPRKCRPSTLRAPAKPRARPPWRRSDTDRQARTCLPTSSTRPPWRTEAGSEKARRPGRPCAYRAGSSGEPATAHFAAPAKCNSPRGVRRESPRRFFCPKPGIDLRFYVRTRRPGSELRARQTQEEKPQSYRELSP